MISSQPKDGDEIVEIQSGPMGGQKFVATRLLLAFFDDLSSLKGGSDQSALIAEHVAAAISRLRAEAESELASASASIEAIATIVGNQSRDIEEINSRLQQVESVCL